MPLENIFETDVLVIGGGMAGCFAAIKAKEQGVDVILIDKGYVSRSGQTPYAEGYLVFNPDWGHDFEGRMKLIKEPIPEEWKPDLSKPYEERYPFKFPENNQLVQRAESIAYDVRHHNYE